MSVNPEQITVYSAITGGKDAPRKDKVKTFTAYDRFKDPRLNAKIYKVLSHKFVKSKWSIWIDGNLELKAEPEQLVAMAGTADIAVFKNPYRNCLYDEAEECKRQGLDDPEIINEQIQKYKWAGYPKNNGLGACFLIIRRNTERIRRLNEAWWAEICRYSSRDQISFPYIYGDTVNYLPKLQPFNNKYFKRKAHLK